MAERKSEAIWIESRSRWQINVQDNGVRKTFTSALAGRRGKADAERKAEKWLKDHTTSEKTRVDVFLNQYTDYLKETKSKSHASQYSGFIRLYIQPVIGVFRMNKLTEGDLQAVIDLAYSKNNLADKTLRDVPGLSLELAEMVPEAGQDQSAPGRSHYPRRRQKVREKNCVAGRPENALLLQHNAVARETYRGLLYPRLSLCGPDRAPAGGAACAGGQKRYSRHEGHCPGRYQCSR